MSLYVEWVNQIKARATPEWLTAGQREAYENLLQRWPAEQIVCLVGPPGSGKSFIARLLVRERGYVYVTSLQELQELEPGPRQVVVDGSEYNRLIRPAAMQLGLKRVVVAQRRLPKDPIPGVEIQLTERDVNQFQHNLTYHGILSSFLTHAKGTDLGQILRAEAVERGNAHARP